MTEAEFTRQVLQLARLLGWRTLHLRPARTLKGWRTPVQGDGKGWLDVYAVRERVLYAELKLPGQKLRPEQEAWVAALLAARQEVYVWTPDDWPEIASVLR